MHMKKGFTLIELLCVLGAMAILCTIAAPVMQQVDERSKDRADQALVLVYNQAMESYRFNDYSTLSLVANKKVMFETHISNRPCIQSALRTLTTQKSLL